MVRWMLSALLGLALVGGAAAQVKKDDAKKDAVKKDDGKKDDKKEITEPKAPGMMVKVKSVDEKAGTITVTTSDKRMMTFKVEDRTTIVGPRMGVSDARLKDDRLAPGSEITVWASADKKTATFIKLSVRKSDDKDKPVKDKAPPKDK